MYCRRPSGFFRTILRSKRHSRFTSVRTEGPFHSRAEHSPQATRWALNSVESLPGNLCEADRSVPTVCTNAAPRGSTQLPRSERPEKAECLLQKRKQALWKNEIFSRNVCCIQSPSTVCHPGWKHRNKTFLNQRKPYGEKKTAFVS